MIPAISPEHECFIRASERRLPAQVVRACIAAAVLFGLMSGALFAAASPTAIDITGNWLESGAHFPAAVQVHEPPLGAKATRAFRQELIGLGGAYTLQLEYLPSLDADPDHPGDAIGQAFEKFDGLTVNGEPRPLHWVKTVEKPEAYTASCPLEVPAAGGPVELGFAWHYTRPPRTKLIGAGTEAGDSRFQALVPSGSKGELLVAHGIPFLSAHVGYDRKKWITGFQRPYDKPGKVMPQAGLVVPWDGAETLDAADAEVKTVHFLGMIHLVDWGNGSWYSRKGDNSLSHFAGDKAGDIVLNWTDGKTTTIPLIFGWNVWFSRPWDMCWHFNMWGGRAHNGETELFGGNREELQLIPDTLALVDGIRPSGATSSNARFIFSVNLEGRALRSVALKSTPELQYGPLISAVTVETAHPASRLPSLPILTAEPSNPKLVTLADIANKTYEPGVQKLMHLLYTFVDELPTLTKPEVPAGYFGPQYDFGPQRDAIYAATFLYKNGPGCAAYIADRGMGCGSPVSGGTLIGNYVECSGIWRAQTPFFKSLNQWFDTYANTPAGQLPGAGGAWSRGVGELMREAMAFGYDKYIDTYTDWLDACLMKEATPPHWNRCPGEPKFVREVRQVGDTEEAGNRENDGHGICMWGRGMAWHWKGEPIEWNRRHFAATVASVDWLQWQLDTDTIYPGTRKDVLFTCSECANHSYDIYSSYNCLHGLELAIRMAEQLERKDLVERWKVLYARLRQGILDNLVDQSEQGPIWHTEAGCDWQDHAHKLVPLHLTTEGDTYTPLQDLARGDDIDRKYLEIDQSTYRYLMREKNYNCLRMYGYGQGMMTQAALLLDQMDDAGKFLAMLLHHSYLPNLAGWATPEGIITHRDDKYYLPVNGYSGQDSHIADATKAVRLLLGVDDNRPEHLRLVPRFPADWTHMAIRQFPVLTGTQRQMLSYTYTRGAEHQQFEFTLEKEAGPVAVRLGPLPAERRVSAASVNGKSCAFRAEHSGDSDWVWLDTKGGRENKIEVMLTAR